jgi:hypothetical protein
MTTRATPDAAAHLRYRIGQGLRALTAFTRPVDRALVGHLLAPVEAALFFRLKRGEQQHSIAVLRALLNDGGGPVPPPLAAAALLHDVGKIRAPLSVWEKTAAVLVRRFAPRLFARWSVAPAGARGRTWPIARACVVYAHHPAWSADLMRRAGAHPDAVWLAAHHAEPAARWREHALYPLLVRLQTADDRH